ncbi:hypothetical protein ACIBL3_45975 [Kribbella sp. NPDC050124]|uniref:hypothetical protein n=1 Tax=Kribbella sp. NPDC050124 TaxID=3364114 RepID=UPI0037B1C276
MIRRFAADAVPLAVLTAYYRRNLGLPPGSQQSRSDRIPERCEDIRITIADSPGNDLRRGVVHVAVAEFAAHTAYLDPVTGMGLLVTPRPEDDVDWSPEGVAAIGLSLQMADRTSALETLADAGWTLLEELGEPMHTTDEGRAVCLYARRTTYEQLVLEDFQRAFAALRTAAELPWHR